MKATETALHKQEHIYDRLAGIAARLSNSAVFRVCFSVLIPLMIFSGLGYLYFFGNGSNLIPGCPFYSLTGLYCPGCGSGRALYSLLHGHLFQAFDYNPAFIILLPLVIYLVLQGYLKVVTRRDILPGVPITLNQATIFTLFILGYSIVRNIPLYPFTYLAP
jgi:hypothetical protein